MDPYIDIGLWLARGAALLALIVGGAWTLLAAGELTRPGPGRDHPTQ
jgi:hypothetical protein